MFGNLSKLKNLFIHKKEDTQKPKSPPAPSSQKLSGLGDGQTVHNECLHIGDALGVPSIDGDYFLSLCLECKVDSQAFRGPEVCMSCRHGTSHPSWNTTRTLTIAYPDTLSKQVETKLNVVVSLWTAKGPVLVGEGSLNTSELKEENCTLVLSILKSKFQGTAVIPGLEPDCIVNIRRASTPKWRKRVFFVRHGESKWNQASAKRDIVGLVKEVDHSLSLSGKNQCLELQDKLFTAVKNQRKLRDEGVEIKDLTWGFLNAKSVLVSPLTRALQTAVIALAYHPLFQDQMQIESKEHHSESAKSVASRNLSLMACARERRNFGGFDTQGKAIGHGILERTEAELRDLYRMQGLPRPIKNMLSHIDVNDCTFQWWNTAKESSESFQSRMKEFCQNVAHLNTENVVVVGHSHFIREFLRSFLSEEFKKAQPKFAKDASTHVVMNCGVIAVDTDFTNPSKPVIKGCKFMFDSEFKIKATSLHSDAKGIFKNLVSSVEGFVKKQTSLRERRKASRDREREGGLWFTLLKEVDSSANIENYQYVDVKYEKKTWNRQLLNMHLGSAYFKKIIAVNPVALRRWYFFEADNEIADEPSPETLELLSFPWDIEEMHNDLQGFGVIQGTGSSTRSRSRSRAKSARSENVRQDRQAKPTQMTDIPAKILGLPMKAAAFLSIGSNTEKEEEAAAKRERQRRSSIARKIKKVPKTLHILQLEKGVQEDDEKGSLITAISGEYRYSAPGYPKVRV